MHLLAKPGCNYLEQDDFIPFLQVLTAAHPGRESKQALIHAEQAVWDGKIAPVWVVQTELNLWHAPLKTFLIYVKKGEFVFLLYCLAEVLAAC